MFNVKCFFTLRSSLLKSFQESLGDLEGTLSHFCPEVEVLLSLGVLERYIADDAEGDERRSEERR